MLHFKQIAQFALVLTGVAHDDQKYDIGEHVPLFVDNLVPFNNPQESYRYFTLKFCKPDPLHHKSQTLGEVLQVCSQIAHLDVARLFVVELAGILFILHNRCASVSASSL